MGNYFGSQSDQREDENTPTFEALEDTPYLRCIRDDEAWRKQIVTLEDDPAPLQKHVTARLPVEITPRVYLGDNASARDVDNLESLGITHIFNVAGGSNKNFDIDYRKILVERQDAQDDDYYPMLANHFSSFREFVARAVETNSEAKVLVHCVAGVNRSGVLATAFLMLDAKIDVVAAVKRVREVRGNYCLVNECFQAELVALARKEGLLGDAPKDAQGVVLRAEQLQRKKLKTFRRGLDRLT